ncbi:MAG: hydroxymethylglutaryl-CoA reductase, degradative [Polyangiaceae bacterium]
MPIDSRVPGFYKLPVDDRREELAKRSGLDAASLEAALVGGLPIEIADKMIENVVGLYALPIGVGLNLRLDDRDYLVPMVVEEPSVVAAMSNAAKMVREGGGFHGEADPPITTAQIQLWDVEDGAAATQAIRDHATELVDAANKAFPDLAGFGGGAREVEPRALGDGLFVVHLHVDVRDAMGANMVNTMAEAIAPRVAELAKGTVGLRILTNLADRRTVRVRCAAPVESLRTPDLAGAEVARRIELASRFAEADPYRAVTHNKGIMNGIDPVVVATGNDWRAVEAGAHAFAARSGAYRPLATWRVTGASLSGQIQLPLALGIVGGTIRVHPGAQAARKLLGIETARELALVAAATGLASNLAALRALATEGIQRGHMNLHARSVAASAGAVGAEVETVAAAMVGAHTISLAAAQAELARLRAPK